MAKQILKDVQILIAGYDLSGSHDNIDLVRSKDVPDKTPFNVDDYVYHPGGQQDFSLSHSGFWEGGAAAVDGVLNGQLSASEHILLVSPSDGALGSVAFFAKGMLSEYQINGEVGGMVGFSGAARSRDRLIEGVVMEWGAKSSDGDGTARQLGAIAAGQSLYAVIQCTAADGTSIDVTVESDDNESFTSATQRLAFTLVVGVGAELPAAVGGPITDDWWRVVWDITGTSYTIHIALAIK